MQDFTQYHVNDEQNAILYHVETSLDLRPPSEREEGSGVQT